MQKDILIQSNFPWFLYFAVPYPELFWSRYTGLGSQTQTNKLSKVLISGMSFRQRSLSQSHESDVLSLFRMQNSQNFSGLCPWTPLGRAYSAPQTNQLQNGFSPRYAHRKTSTPKKLLDMAMLCSKYFVQNCSTPLGSEIFLTLNNFGLKNVDWRRSGVIIINFVLILKSIQQIKLVFLL